MSLRSCVTGRRAIGNGVTDSAHQWIVNGHSGEDQQKISAAGLSIIGGGSGEGSLSPALLGLTSHISLAVDDSLVAGAVTHYAAGSH